MRFDSAAYARLGATNSMGTSASGAAFATTTGDILEVSCFGPGIFRLRVGPNTRPDYGLVVGRAQRCDVAQPGVGKWTFTAGNSRLEMVGEPMSLRLVHDDHAVLTSTTDEHFRGFTRLPVIGRARSGTQWTAAFALASGEAVYGLGEKFGSLNKRGQLVHSRNEDALGVNTGLSYKNAPFCRGRARAPGACSSTRRRKSRTALAIPIGRTAPTGSWSMTRRSTFS
jgi:alpha-glucosidase (family GH31 glycosyl hydrolase)